MLILEITGCCILSLGSIVSYIRGALKGNKLQCQLATLTLTLGILCVTFVSFNADTLTINRRNVVTDEAGNYSIIGRTDPEAKLSVSKGIKISQKKDGKFVCTGTLKDAKRKEIYFHSQYKNNTREEVVKVRPSHKYKKTLKKQKDKKKLKPDKKKQ